MQSFVEGVIYFYVFVCVMLMLFNVLYIARSQWAERKTKERTERWKATIEESRGSFVLNSAQVKSLHKLDNFAAFSRAIAYWVLGTDSSDEFFCNNSRQIQELALDYARRDAMERAFMASFIASFRCPAAPNSDMLAEILLSYLDDSTVFCRENVLQALYALGRTHPVENAFHMLNENHWYHSPKLLSDGMAMFTSSHEELVFALWRNHSHWEEFLNVPIVTFASFLDSPGIKDEFERVFLNENVTVEVRFALIRYFRRHPSDAVLPLLYDYVASDGQFAIPAASALASYDTEETRVVLHQALCSRNWYVRHNAALSLTSLGLTGNDIAEIYGSGDRYAVEMLEYVADHTGNRATLDALKEEAA